MTYSNEQLREIAAELPMEQRIFLANSLLQKIDVESEEASNDEVQAAWDAEIATRVHEVRSGTARTCTLEELEADLNEIVGK
jgi:hypothetical protein